MMSEKYSVIHRPQDFDEICGNIEVVSLLKEKSRIGKLDKMTIIHGHSGVGKSTLIYIIAKAFLCRRLKEDGNPCCVCESCVELQKTLYVNGKVNRNSGVEIFDMGKDGDEYGYINKIAQRVNTPFTRGRRVLILEEMHNTSVKNQQKLNTSLEYIPDDVIILIPTSDYYSKISNHLKTRSTDYMLTNPGRNLIVDYLFKVSNDIVSHTGGKMPLKKDLRKLVTLKNSNMRECVDSLSLLIDCGDIGRDYIMGDYNKSLDKFVEFMRSVKMGIIGLTEFVNELSDRALFLQSLPRLLEQGISLRSVANDLIEPDIRREINTLMADITEIKIAKMIKDMPRTYNMQEDEARMYLWCIGIELNSAMTRQLNLTDEENSAGSANAGGNLGGIDIIDLLDNNIDINRKEIIPFSDSNRETEKDDYIGPENGTPGNTLFGEINIDDL